MSRLAATTPSIDGPRCCGEAQNAAQVAAETMHPLARVGHAGHGLGVRDEIALQDVRAQVYRDQDVGAHRAAERYGDGVGERTVDEHRAFARHGTEETGHCHRSADRFERGACTEPRLRAGFERRRDGAERDREALDRALLEDAARERHQPRAVQEPPVETHVEHGNHVAHAHPDRPLLEAFEVARRIGRTNERTRRSSADQVGSDPRALQRTDHTDVRPAARRAAAEHEADSRSARSSGRRRGDARPGPCLATRRSQSRARRWLRFRYRFRYPWGEIVGSCAMAKTLASTPN